MIRRHLRGVALIAAAVLAPLLPTTAAHAATYVTKAHWDYAGSGEYQREYQWETQLWASQGDNQTQPGVCMITAKINANGAWPYLEYSEVSGQFTMTGPDGQQVSGTFPTKRLSISDNNRTKVCSWGSTTGTFQPGTWTVSVSVTMHSHDNRLFHRPTYYDDSFTYDNQMFDYSTG